MNIKLISVVEYIQLTSPAMASRINPALLSYHCCLQPGLESSKIVYLTSETEPDQYHNNMRHEAEVLQPLSFAMLTIILLSQKIEI